MLAANCSRARTRLPLIMALALLPSVQILAAPEASAGAGTVGLDARSWLTRIHAAANSGNYQGTMVYSVGGTVSSSKVWHYAVGDQSFEQTVALDGRQQRISRRNDEVQTVWPQARTAVIERREIMGAWSTTPQAVGPQALDQYDMRRESDGRVAGREAAVFVLEPRDALRYAQRLWADQETGLLLRADVIDPTVVGARSVLESTQFSEVAIGIKPQPEQVTQSFGRKLDGYRIVRPRQQRTSLENEGWMLSGPVAGFMLAGCMRRGMDAAGDDEPVLQAVFSDGLTHVSVFIEIFRLPQHRNEGLAQQGATATLMQRRGDFRFTVVGDVPPASLKLFLAALERRRP